MPGEVIGKLIGKFLGHTKIGRFILGGVLGGIVMNLIVAMLFPLGNQWAAWLYQTTFGETFFSNLGFSKDMLSLAIIMELTLTIGCVIAICLFREHKKDFYWSIGVYIPLTGLLLFLFVIPRQNQFVAALAAAVIGYLPFILSGGIKMAIRNPIMGAGKHIRGTDKLKGNEKQVEHQLRALAQKENRGQPRGTTLWEKVDLPYPRENQGILIIGSPGSGKTQFTFPLIQQVYEKGDKAIIWDVKGSYLQALAGKPDVAILAPWDNRSIKWRPGADILRPLDCHQAAHILIPNNPKESQPYFNTAAREIVGAILIQLDATGDSWGWQDVWQCVAQGKANLYSFLQRTQEGRSAASMIEGDSKAGQDVYSTLISHLKPISWLAKAWKNEGVSLRQWLEDPTSKILIIGGMVENEELAAMTARLALQILVNEVLAMPDDLNRRVWLFLDELSALNSNKSLIDAFTTGRSKGLCTVAGIQDIGRIEHLYSHELAKSIINVFSTNIFLRCIDPATNQWASEAIGNQESADLISETESGALTKSKNTSVRHKPVFMASEIANFPDLTGVLKVAGWPVAKVKWTLKPIPQQFPRVVDAPWVNQKAKLDDMPPPKDDTPPPPPPNNTKPDQPKWGV